MAYQSQYSGAQIDNAVGKINAACNLIGAFYNLQIPITIDQWVDNTISPNRGRFMLTLRVELPAICQNPYVFIKTGTRYYGVDYELDSSSNPNLLRIYANVKMSSNAWADTFIIIQSGAGLVDNTYTAEVEE